MIMIDVLHTLDLGISQQTLGNLFFMFYNSPLAKGSTRKGKTHCLWMYIKSYYKRSNPPTQISALTPEMIKQDSKGPKFRAKGAEIRHFFAVWVRISRFDVD